MAGHDKKITDNFLGDLFTNLFINYVDCVTIAMAIVLYLYHRLSIPL